MVTVEPTESSNEIETLENNFSHNRKKVKEASWNGRSICVDSCYNHVNLSLNVRPPKMVQCNGTFGGAIKDYFDPDEKKAQEFEINVLLHAIRCSSTDEAGEKLKEVTRLADQFTLSTGLIGVAILSRDYKTALTIGTALYFLVKERTFVTLQELKTLLKERGKDYEDVHFYSLWEDYQKNQQELRSKGVILDSFRPHYTQNPHYQSLLI